MAANADTRSRFPAMPADDRPPRAPVLRLDLAARAAGDAPDRPCPSGAFSENTERGLRADLAVYAAWCAERGLTALPAEAMTIAAFVDAMAMVRAPATVRRYVASVAAANRTRGRVDSAREAPVQLALKRMHRRFGRRQQQARGLNWELRKRLLTAAGDRLIDHRNRALVAVAYDGMLRRSELAEVTVADLAVEDHGAATLLVRRAKTDPEGSGASLYLARDTVALVQRWLDQADITAGRLFRSVNKGGRLGVSLDPSQIPRIFKAMARTASLPPEVVDSLSGHSARIGAVQDMIASGIEIAAILHAGRWKSPAMVSRYGEQLLARQSGAAQLARLQGRE